MNKSVLITKSGELFNRHVLCELLEQGCSVAMVFREREEADRYAGRLTDRNRERFFPLYGVPNDEAGIRAAVDEAAGRMGALHLLIHGAEVLDEEEAYSLNPAEFGVRTAAVLRSAFLYSRAAAEHMARSKAGHIVYLLLSDSLYYDGYPSSPVLNQGTIAMMKTLAKELSPFRVAVNAVTFGYYAIPDDRIDKKELKQRLEIHTLKPYLPQPQELVAASLACLLHTPEYIITGQNMQIGAGGPP